MCISQINQQVIHVITYGPGSAAATGLIKVHAIRTDIYTFLKIISMKWFFQNVQKYTFFFL